MARKNKNQLIQDAAKAAVRAGSDDFQAQAQILMDSGEYDTRIKVGDDLVKEISFAKASLPSDEVAALQAEGKPKAKREKAPDKPATKPDSLNYKDYGWEDSKGRFRFFQGFDMAYKARLMRAARQDPDQKVADEAMRELARRTWSTGEVEREKRAAYMAKQEAKAKK